MRQPEVEIAGGGATELAIAGNAFEDQVAAGAVTEDVAPVSEDAPTEVAPERAPELTPTEAVDEVMPETMVAELPEPPDVVEPEETAAEAEETAEEETPPATDDVIEPVEETASVAALVDIPVPTPRPHHVPQKVEAEPQPQKRVQQAARQPASGSQGQDRQDAKRGSSSSNRDGQANEGRRVARASQSGNAQVSNYPGKVVSRLRRALRYPGAAKRDRLRGETHVRFTVSQNGGVSGLSVVRSSGSSVLDQAALETVQRAAPFPAIPPGAGRSSWRFTVPLAFVR